MFGLMLLWAETLGRIADLRVMVNPLATDSKSNLDELSGLMRITAAGLYRADLNTGAIAPDAQPIDRYDCFEFPQQVELRLRCHMKDIAEERVVFIHASSPRMDQLSSWFVIEHRNEPDAWNDFELAFEAPFPGPYRITLVSNDRTLSELPLQIGPASEKSSTAG
jgi:hypothetical protein